MRQLLPLALAAAVTLAAQTAAPKPTPAKTAKQPAATVRSNARNTAAVGTVPSYKSLKFPALREVRIPDITQFTLPNGMRVFLLENHELPLVSGFALVRTGNLF